MLATRSGNGGNGAFAKEADAPSTVESYGDEVRETFLERADLLHFRVRDGDAAEQRFYSSGREDAVREVAMTATSSRIVFGNRSDRATDLARELDEATRCWKHVVNFSGREDGVRRVALSLRRGAELEVGRDTAVSLYNEKVQHLGVLLDPSTNTHRLADVYQDRDARLLRIAFETGDLSAHIETCNFPNDVPTQDPRYELGKTLLMNAMQLVVALERQLFVTLPPFALSQADASALHAQRMQSLAASLFASLDMISGSPQRSGRGLEAQEEEE